MITTPYEKIQNDLRSIPKDQLISMGNNPSPQYPTYMIATEMQRRVQDEKAMAAQQTRDQAGQPTVVEGVMDEFANTGGLSQAQPMMAMNQEVPPDGIQMMATGGRVGYQEGRRLGYTPNLDDLTEEQKIAYIQRMLRKEALGVNLEDSFTVPNPIQRNVPVGDGVEMVNELQGYEQAPMSMIDQIRQEREVESIDGGLEEFSLLEEVYDAPFTAMEEGGEYFNQSGMPIAGAALGIGANVKKALNPKNWIKGLGQVAKNRGWKSGKPKRGPGKVKTNYQDSTKFIKDKNGPDQIWNNKTKKLESGRWETKKIPSSTNVKTGKGTPIQKTSLQAGKDALKTAGYGATGMGTAGTIGYGGYQAYDNILSPEARQADEDAINAEELAFREKQKNDRLIEEEKEARQAAINAQKQLNADALIAEQDKENQMALQALATQKTESAKRDKQMGGLDMARFGLAIAGANNVSDLSEGLGGIVTDIQTRRREDQEYERGDELIQAQIGQLKALSESYAVKGEFAKVRELNDFATNASNVLNQLTNSGRGPSDPSYIALSEQLSLALMEISQELGLFVPSGPPDNTTANQTTINNSPYVNNP